jgi:hypothetical protein
MKLIARKAITYSGARLRAGQEFSAKSARDARILQAAGRAAPCVAPPPAPLATAKPARTYKRRDLVAESPNAPPAAIGGLASAAEAGGERSSPPASTASQASATADQAPVGES